MALMELSGGHRLDNLAQATPAAPKLLSFRGRFLPKESLFSSALNEERFLARRGGLGMTP